MVESEAHRPKILIVDDSPENVEVLSEILKPFYRRSVALDGEKALQIAASADPPDLILLDIILPGLDGYEVCRRLKAKDKSREIPVIFVTVRGEVEDEAKGFDSGAVDYITKPISPSIVLARVKTHLELRAAREALARQNEILELKVKERTEELALTQDATVLSLASLAETRDNETGSHIRRTQSYVRVLAEHLSNHAKFFSALDRETIERLFKSTPLHDMGKVGIPDSILLKPGKLTSGEFEIMKTHTTLGRDALLKAEILYQGKVSSSFLRLAREIVYSHHERWNGAGYPEGLCGTAIPLPGRLMAIADVYDALVTARVYKSPIPHEEAVAIMAAEEGRQFDPDVLNAFLAIQDKFSGITQQFADPHLEKDRTFGKHQAR